MTISLALLAAQALAPPPAAQWPDLPAFPLQRAAITPEAAQFVRDEVAAGRCAEAALEPDADRVAVPLAVLVGTGGIVRQVVPQAIRCPTIEQFTVGYVLAATRSGSGSPSPAAPGWYRLIVGYRW